ncbi:MAG: hypothetical protein N4A46_01000, partial [Schleiferiaceae bacterium]|nr:hypothetical protein [Schleiferiaceae bacterium]
MKNTFVLTFFLYSVFTLGQGFDVRVNKDSVKAPPGSTIKLFFSSSICPNGDSIQLQTNMPEGWRLVPEKKEFSIKKGGKLIYVSSVYVPRNAPATQYNLSFKFQNRLLDTVDIPVQVVVSEKHKLSLDVFRYGKVIPNQVKSKGSFVIRNEGNVPEELQLETYGCVIDGENKISILPDSSKVVQVDVLPKLNVYEITGYSYGLVLRTDSIMLKNDVSVKVLPNARDKIDPYKRYVVRTNLRYLGRYLRGEYSDGYQFNINGSGELKRPGHQFDFVIQGPNSSELSLNSTFSQYSARYEAPKFIIQGGHGSYSVSRLIENSRNGFGGQLAYKAEKWKASAFYVKPRFYPQITGQSGATFDYNFKRESRLGLNY